MSFGHLVSTTMENTVEVKSSQRGVNVLFVHRFQLTMKKRSEKRDLSQYFVNTTTVIINSSIIIENFTAFDVLFVFFSK